MSQQYTAVHTNLHYHDGSVIATDCHNTPIPNGSSPSEYTAALANTSGAAYASTTVYDSNGAYVGVVYASYDGVWQWTGMD